MGSCLRAVGWGGELLELLDPAAAESHPCLLLLLLRQPRVLLTLLAPRARVDSGLEPLLALFWVSEIKVRLDV